MSPFDRLLAHVRAGRPIYHCRSTYVALGCRCAVCCAENSAYSKHYYWKRLARDQKRFRILHGTRTAYCYDRCRCAQCLEAERLYQRQWRARNRQEVRT